MKYVPGYRTLENVAEWDFEKEVCDRLKFIVDYLSDNLNLFETPNEDDYLNYEVYEPIPYDEEEDW
jgi:hypothetical protein